MQTGEPLHIDEGNPRPMRAMNLSNALVQAGHNVVLWSSAFFHSEKKHRSTSAKTIQVSDSLQIRLVPSPGYQRNIGPARLRDHAVMARNLVRQLNEVDKSELPDVAFLGYPPIETAAAMGRWLKKRNIKYIIDVKDQWPSIFVEALPSVLQPVGRVAFSPYYVIAKRALKKATGLTGMSNGFVKWAADFAGREVNDFDRVVPLTKPDDQVSPDELRTAGEWWDTKGIKDDGTPRMCFVGSHSPAFDMAPVYQAAKELAEKNNTFQFVICGDGPDSVAWQQMMAGLPNVFFPGWVNRAQAEALGKRSVAALGPYHNVPNFVMNLPNKILDSLAQGLPILSPLKGEVETLISKYKVGMSYGGDFGISLTECIKRISSDSNLQRDLSSNAKMLFEKEFVFDKIYGGLVSHLEMLAAEK